MVDTSLHHFSSRRVGVKRGLRSLRALSQPSLWQAAIPEARFATALSQECVGLSNIYSRLERSGESTLTGRPPIRPSQIFLFFIGCRAFSNKKKDTSSAEFLAEAWKMAAILIYAAVTQHTTDESRKDETRLVLFQYI